MGDLILGIIGFAFTAAAASMVFGFFRIIHIVSAAEMMDDEWWPEDSNVD